MPNADFWRIVFQKRPRRKSSSLQSVEVSVPVTKNASSSSVLAADYGRLNSFLRR